jgi:hypothetical protein
MHRARFESSPRLQIVLQLDHVRVDEFLGLAISGCPALQAMAITALSTTNRSRGPDTAFEEVSPCRADGVGHGASVKLDM